MNAKSSQTSIDRLYDYISGDEDARVCKDIPEAACHDQPRNFFAYLLANLLGKIADEIGSAKLILPWLFGLLQVPAVFTGLLVPIREGGVLLPQLAVAAAVRRMPIRKHVWLLGAVLSAFSLFGMAWVALNAEGAGAGAAIIAMLIVFSLARGLCSVSAKDVLGKTVSKSRRGRLMGWSSSASGIAVLLLGLWLGASQLAEAGVSLFASLLLLGGVLWLAATVAFAAILEQPGATEGGGNALTVALQQLSLLRTDQKLRRFIMVRGLLLSVALASPFYVLLAQSVSGTNPLGLGVLIVANGLAASISSPFWGHMGDRSSRQVIALAAAGSGLLGVFTFMAFQLQWSWVTNAWGIAVIFMLLDVMHGGVRLGRKVYLIDMATAETRAAYVAVSNTVIGLLMIGGGLVGLLGDWLGASVTVLVLGLMSLLAAFACRWLPEVSEG